MAGELSGKLGDLESSQVYYAQVLELTDDPDIIERAMRVAIRSKDWPQALHAAKRWAAVQPERIETQQVLGVLFLSIGDVDGAEKSFLKVMQAASDSPRQGFAIVMATLSQVKHVENGLALMERLVSQHFTSAYGHLAYANLAMGAGKYRLAVDESELALGFNPKLTKARILRARALNALGDHELALKEMQELVELEPENYEQRMGYAQMLLQASLYLEAAEQFEVLLEIRPEEINVTYMLGLTYVQAQEYEKGRFYFQSLVDENRRLDESFYYLGMIAEELGDSEQAQAMYLEVAFGEWYLEASMRLADLYYETDGVDKAREHLKSVRDDLQDVGNVVRIYLAEGSLLYQKQHHQLAYEVYSQGLLEFPKHFDLLYARAISSESLDQIDMFEADMRSIIEADPKHVDALNALGYTLVNRSLKISEAKSFIERAYALRPQDPAIIDSMGWLHFRLGNYRESESFLRDAIDKTYDAEIVGHLVELLRATARHREASDLLKQARDRFPDDEYLQKLNQDLSSQ
jgi:tetratricopeptide (TPR) repeat protein